MSPSDLERLVGQALERLPAPRAPHTLLPRVLEAVRHADAQPRPSGWRAWPLAVQVAAGVLIALAVGAALTFGPQVRDTVAGNLAVSAPEAATPTTALLERAVQATGRAEAALEAIRILWRVVLGPVMVYAAALILLMCLVCAGLELSLTWRSRRAHSS